MVVKGLQAISLWTASMCCTLLALLVGCESEDDVLAPYGVGSRPLSSIVIEDNVFIPQVTWLGGYVSVFGVNRGSTATLDSSLGWLIRQSGDNLHYPVKLNTLPVGAQDLTVGFGGRPLTKLAEDNQYTFWVLRDDAWGVVSANPGRPIVADSTVTQIAQLRNDTVVVSTRSFAARTSLTDVYINIKDAKAFGRLITDINTFVTYFTITASDTSNRPVITWNIVQQGVTDQRVAAIGISEGTDYSAFTGVWEMISKNVQPDTIIYWKDNVIGSPLLMGASVPGTATFKEYPAEGLRRGSAYYLWIANKDWDGKSRSRTANYYAYMTFTVW